MIIITNIEINTSSHSLKMDQPSEWSNRLNHIIYFILYLLLWDAIHLWLNPLIYLTHGGRNHLYDQILYVQLIQKIISVIIKNDADR